MKKILKNIKLFILKNKLTNKKIFIRKGVKFEGARFQGCGKIGNNTNIKFSNIGYGTYIGKNCNLNSTKIGKFCSIGSNVKIIIGDHPVETYVSTHPVFHSNKLKKEGLNYQGYKERKTYRNIGAYGAIIGNDVWIGDNVLILGGVTIGDGSVIGAGAVVTKDVPTYTIVAGVPAKEISKRFTEKERIFLEDFNWWDKEVTWIKENVRDFSDITNFRKKWEKSLKI